MNVAFASDKPLDIEYYGYKSTAGVLVDVTDGIASEDKDYLAVISVYDNTADAPVVTVGENINENGLRGCRVNVASDGIKSEDIILFSADGAVSYGAVCGKAGSAMIFGAGDAVVYGYAVTDGTELTYGGKLLISADSAVSAAISFERGDGDISVVADTAVRIYTCRKSGGVAVDGCVYAINADGYAEFRLGAGKYGIRIL